MYQTEDILSKFVVTADGEQEFKIRYIRDENVGIVTTQTDKSYFILDSAEYWYDLIQEKYPPIMKCSCKNDLFNLLFEYTPRKGTDDFKEINITCKCVHCQKSKQLPTINIDYSPSSQLFDNPITYCKQPKIKYKTYSLMGYWSEEELFSLVQYFLETQLFIYCWYWDSQNTKRCAKELSAKELYAFLSGRDDRYLAIYFSPEPLSDIFMHAPSDEQGVYIQQNIWRKECVFMLHGPFSVVPTGMFYHMEFCSEYLDKHGNIVRKTPSFCTLTQEFRKHSKRILQNKSSQTELSN